MATYWVFCLENARVTHHLDYEAEDDAEAMKLMTIRREERDCELWCGDRKVATVTTDNELILVGHAR